MPILVIRTLLPLYKKEFKFETSILHYAFVIYQLFPNPNHPFKLLNKCFCRTLNINRNGVKLNRKVSSSWPPTMSCTGLDWIR